MNKKITWALVIIVIIILAVIVYNKNASTMKTDTVQETPAASASPVTTEKKPTTSTTPAQNYTSNNSVVAPVSTVSASPAPAAPFISSITPKAVSVNSSDNSTLVISGTGFSPWRAAGQSNTVVLTGTQKNVGTVQITDVYSDLTSTGSKITIVLPKSMFTGTYTVTVKNQYTNLTSAPFSSISVTGMAPSTNYNY